MISDLVSHVGGLVKVGENAAERDAGVSLHELDVQRSEMEAGIPPLERQRSGTFHNVSFTTMSIKCFKNH